jgi:hypothetical protein
MQDNKANGNFKVPDSTIEGFAQAHSKSTRHKRPPRKLILLSGFANTGKDTVLRLLKEISPEPIVRVSFADILKTECYPIISDGAVEYTGPDTEDREWKDAHREDIIRYGEGQKMKHGQYYWVKRALDDVLKTEYENGMQIPHIVVTDARRTEEIMWMKHYKLGHFAELNDARNIWEPIMMVVHKDGAEKDNDYLTHICLEYAAETRAFLRLIKNNGTIKELEQHLKDVYVRDIR